MAILLISSEARMAAWKKVFQAELPNEVIRCWPDFELEETIDIVIIAEPKTGLFEKLKNLKLVIAQRAGVEDLVDALRSRPDVKLCRAQRPDGDRMIDDYALLCVMYHHRNFQDLILANSSREWINPEVSFSEECTVGIMGLGVIGSSVARRIRDAGYRVVTWNRSGANEKDMEHFSGPEGFKEFMGKSKILVNLLALTSETKNIINSNSIDLLPTGAAFINLGRGEHVVDEDLIVALKKKQLSAATLDVFREEPLPREHPFWQNPRILVMPHIARRPRIDFLTPQLIENIRRFRDREPLLQEVDVTKGY